MLNQAHAYALPLHPGKHQSSLVVVQLVPEFLCGRQ